MKIRRLEIQGFKSFADRTVLRFGEGITGVVGPNGCGKSNIVDAIRWVMGEQSAKQLRGGGMQDVIFAGCEARGPMGMSEVTIGFKNTGGLVPPEYQGLDEIAVTRRLFRDGSSQYAINKVPCRLRDILDLFMGTGIGKNAYSIIEQGRIGLIVTAKPEDRRAIIEDAAGVSRYKARRKQAERRIQATEQNLLRVNDLTTELAKQKTSLERQAKKAARYQALKSELKGLELHAAAHRYLELWALERFAQAGEQTLRNQLQGQALALEDEEQALAEEAGRVEGLGEALRAAEAELGDKEKQLAVTDQQLAHLRGEGERLIRDRDAAEGERVELGEERAQLEVERAAAEALGAALGDSEGEESAQLKAQQAELSAQGASLAETEAALEAAKQALSKTLAGAERHESNQRNLKRSQAELGEQQARGQAAQAEAQARAKEAEAQAKRAQRRLDDNRQLKLSLDDRDTAQQAELSALQAELDTLAGAVEDSRQALMDKRSRLASLTRIQDNYEGCTEAVRRLMQAQEAGELGVGLHGLVADVISADAKLETAIEAVLGDRLQSVIVNELADGVASVAFLQAEEGGRGSFVPMAPREQLSEPPLAPSSRPPTAASAPPLAEAARAAHSELPVPEVAGSFIDWTEAAAGVDTSDPAVIGRLGELVQAQPGYAPLARVLLGDVFVVEDLAAAQRLWAAHPGASFVTLKGELLDANGVLSGGSSVGVSAGLLAQKREIKELSQQVERLTVKLQVGQEQQEGLKTRVQALGEGLKALQEERHQEALSILNLERDLKRHQDDAARERAQVEAEGSRLGAIEDKAARLAEELAADAAEAEALAASKGELTVQVQTLGEALGQQRRALDAASAGVTELRVKVAANRERREGAAQDHKRIVDRLAAVATRLKRLAAVMDSYEETQSSLTEQVAQAEQARAGLAAAVAEEGEAVQAARAALEQAREAQRARDAALKDGRRGLEKERESLAKIQLRVQEQQLARANLEAQIDERYRLQLSEVVSDYHQVDPQPAEDAGRAKKLKKQLDGIGAINLTAIEEFDGVRERYDFLMGQKQDLEAALGALRAAIKRINKTSKQRYVEAFARVNEKFQQVFPKLFNGGRCELVMTDPADPLESGIEMLAQPPGKKLQSVNLLSGGEKALTAVALIFAIFLIKPTPFCLLDEVDAPLDEANVGRYNELLREMSSVSQFILITHNKRTMELPDRLYGVTMQTPGISKLVPVDVVAPAERQNVA